MKEGEGSKREEGGRCGREVGGKREIGNEGMRE
jgi:hypothetical protein